ncbi:MAG: thiamine-phosphate kinase [Deltaproteobacteria bacterium CG17_big_fil_post_rev_8_21_14_2_50_63_7]|nr:MAG: thiamine-phosphate kinase [Deltaproteobacteria bacterium CG17_big_fil_post_rev_8_21_14_2_50_63_7]
MLQTESDIIGHLRAAFPQRDDIAPLGIGDDTARLAPGWDLVTMDTMTEGVHFERRYASYGDIAFRALSANLSDIAAMGGEPGPFLISLAIPKPGFDEPALQSLIRGFVDCLDAHQVKQCVPIGGDVVRSAGGFTLSITLLGHSPAPGPVLRTGAQAGDVIVVFRALGASALGLELLQRGEQDRFPALARAHLRPLVDVQLGAAIGQASVVSSMLDLSDGLWTDLPRLLQGGIGARIDADCLPQHEDILGCAEYLGVSAIQMALTGGEDFTLLATVPRAKLETLRDLASLVGCKMTAIGEIVAESGVTFEHSGRPLQVDDSAFRHF